MQNWQKVLLGGSVIIVSIGGALLYGKSSFWQLEEQLPQEDTVGPVSEEQSMPVLEEGVQAVQEVIETETPERNTSAEQSAVGSKQPTTEDCEQGCEGFGGATDTGYCMAFCGLDQGQYQNQDCTSLVGASKDFCFKEQAIRERNSETCARISERSLRRACEARIAEDLFDR